METAKVIYILGSQRGGTTIAGRVLGTLDGVHYGGELRRLWEKGLAPGRTCGCGESFPDCPYWSQILPRVLSENRDPEAIGRWQNEVAPSRRSWRQVKVLLDPDFRSRTPAFESYSCAMGDMYRAIAEVAGARVIVDNSKLPSDAAVLRYTEGIDPYLLHVVRDPRGVVSSEMRRTGKPLSPTGQIRAAVLGSAFWTARERAARKVVSRCYPGSSLVLRYEDFIENPAAGLNRILEMVGEPVPESVESRTEYAFGEVHTPGGRTPARVAKLALDDRWRTELGKLPLVLTTVLTMPGLLRYRYLGRRRNTSEPMPSTRTNSPQ